MMKTLFTDIPEFQEYMKKHNITDKFEAIMTVSKLARMYSDAFPQLEEKDAISWVLRGEPSESYKKKLNKIKLEEKLKEKKFDLLAYVDDEEVRISCEKSIELSLKTKVPTFVYSEELSEENKARVRIITKLTFDQQNS